MSKRHHTLVKPPLMTDDWPTHHRRSTQHWCKGVVGQEHVWQQATTQWGGTLYHCEKCGKQNYGRDERSIAAQIRALRKAKGWTQEQLAESLDVTQSRIAQIENPHTYWRQTYTVDLLERVAYALGKHLVITFEDRE